MLLHCSMRYKLFVLLVALLAILIWVAGCVVQFLVRTAAIMHVRHRATSRGQATHTTWLDSVQSSSRAGFTPQSLLTTQTCSAIRVLIGIGAICYGWTHQPANQSAVQRIAAGSATLFIILLVLACGTPLPGSGPVPSGGGAVGAGSWPVPPGTPITRGYGCHPFYTGVRGPCGNLWWHDGIDWAAAPGTPLFAVRDITIQYAGADTGTMNCAWIDGSQPPHTGFGYYVKAADGAGLVYWYGHVSSFAVAAGQQVANGTQVAGMGSTGCSTGAHLHFRVRQNGLDLDPLTILQQP